MGTTKKVELEVEGTPMAGDDEVERPTLFVQAYADYDTFAEIGKGQFGVVSTARLRRGAASKRAADQPAVVAVKQLRFDFEKEGFPLEALREITLLSSVRHANIVRMHAVACGDGDSPAEWHLVMEPAGHELTTLVKGARRRPFAEAHVKHLMLQLLRALAALHSVWVMHRDLKTPNVLVDDAGVLRLCDFGLARRVCCGDELDDVQYSGEAENFGGFSTTLYGDTAAKRDAASDESDEPAAKRRREAALEGDAAASRGRGKDGAYGTHTPNVISGHYRPPEVLLGVRDYGRGVDVWSAGCIMGELLSRVVLFAGKDEPDQLRQVFTLLGEPTAEEWPLYPHLARARGFRFENPGDVQIAAFKLKHGHGGSELLRRRFPATGFDGNHLPLTALSLVTPHAHMTTSLSNTGFSLLTRLLECCPERRVSSNEAKRDRWFSMKPGPEPLQPGDLQPLLQLAKLTDSVPAVPAFMGTGFSSQPLPSILLAQGAANFNLAAFQAASFGLSVAGMQPQQASVAAALAVARARALALTQGR